MSNEKRSKKILIIATALMIVALGAVISVYATSILGTFKGGNVTVVEITGTVTYSSDNAPTGIGSWSSTLTTVGSSSWYSRLEITGGGYTGSVMVTFQLEELVSGNWQAVGNPVITSAITLTGSPQSIYASTDGLNSDNTDWSNVATSGGTYEIVATVNSAS